MRMATQNGHRNGDPDRDPDIDLGSGVGACWRGRGRVRAPEDRDGVDGFVVQVQAHLLPHVRGQLADHCSIPNQGGSEPSNL